MERGDRNVFEVLAFIEALGVAIGKEIRGDGLQVADAFKFLESEAFREHAAKAFEGIELVPGEVSDTGLVDGFLIGKRIIEVSQSITDALKK